jgi:hypothetical protein
VLTSKEPPEEPHPDAIWPNEREPTPPSGMPISAQPGSASSSVAAKAPPVIKATRATLREKVVIMIVS